MRSPPDAPVRRGLFVGASADAIALGPDWDALHVELDARPGIDAIAEHAADVVVVDGDPLDGPALQALATALAVPGVAERVVLLASSPGPELVPLFAGPGLRHLCPRTGDGARAALAAAVAAILQPAPLRLETCVDDGAIVAELALTNTRDKAQVLARGEELARELGASERATALFVSCVEELVTNALFNAPVDAAGRPRFAHLARDAKLALDDGREVRVRFAQGSDRIGVSVVDPYGSLSPSRALSYLAKGLAGAGPGGGGNRIDSKEGGAGLGLYTVFHGASRFALEIVPGARTHALAVVEAGRGVRSRRSPGRSFSLFVGEPRSAR